MNLGRLLTRNFRNLAQEPVEFHPSVNLFIGDNGQGKTNLLEAIHVLATTKSFRVTRSEPLVAFGESQVYIEGTIEEEGLRKEISIGIAAAPERRRELLFNGQKIPLASYIRRLPVVAYSSAQLEIVKGGPEWRRRFLDRGVAGVEPAHLEHLNRYTKVIRQRNALLSEIGSRRSGSATLDAWDAELVDAAAPILAARRRYISRLEDRYREIVSAHNYHVDQLGILWTPAGMTGERDADLDRLRSERPREIAIGHTRQGPHRDLLEFLTHGRPAAEVLSSGEIKMTVLFLTLATMEEFRSKWGTSPIFLLDDIDAELDLGIVRRLTRYLAGVTQIFTTSPKEPLAGTLEFGARREFSVHEGSITLAREIGE